MKHLIKGITWVLFIPPAAGGISSKRLVPAAEGFTAVRLANGLPPGWATTDTAHNAIKRTMPTAPGQVQRPEVLICVESVTCAGYPCQTEQLNST